MRRTFKYNPPIRIISKHILTIRSYRIIQYRNKLKTNNLQDFLASGVIPASVVISVNSDKFSHSPRSRRSIRRAPPSKHNSIQQSNSRQIQHKAKNQRIRPREKRVETKRKPLILGAGDDLGQEICDHFFRDTVKHGDITKTDVTPDKVVTNLQVPHVTKSSRIGRNMQASH